MSEAVKLAEITESESESTLRIVAEKDCKGRKLAVADRGAGSPLMLMREVKVPVKDASGKRPKKDASGKARDTEPVYRPTSRLADFAAALAGGLVA